MAGTATERATTMKAIVRDKYGSPDVLQLREAEQPEFADDGVLVRVRAASVNRLDWYDVTGMPWIARPMTGLRKPKGSRITGRDFAGTVEAVGKDVTDLHWQPVRGPPLHGSCCACAYRGRGLGCKEFPPWHERALFRPAKCPWVSSSASRAAWPWP